MKTLEIFETKYARAVKFCEVWSEAVREDFQLAWAGRHEFIAAQPGQLLSRAGAAAQRIYSK